MNPVGFGKHVVVHALAMRVIGYMDGDTVRFKNSQANDIPWFEPTAVGDWPGEPIELDWDLPKGPGFPLEPTPNGKEIVRWRRLALDSPQQGIVIGATFRQEGVLTSAAMLGPKRSVNVYQVALDPPRRSYKALVVFVHPQDIQLITTEERGVPAPTRVGVGGRIGGGRLGGG